MLTAVNSDPLLAEMVRRLSEFGGISRVVLFGSRARGDHEELSDYDLLIIVPDEIYRKGMDLELRHLLSDIRTAKDLVLAKQSTIDEQSGVPGTIYYEAALDGIQVYG